MEINYNEISRIYENVRKENSDIIEMFTDEVNITEETMILDFGCGTGNYTDALQRHTKGRVYGLEPSDGMREKAIIDKESYFKKTYIKKFSGNLSLTRKSLI